MNLLFFSILNCILWSLWIKKSLKWVIFLAFFTNHAHHSLVILVQEQFFLQLILKVWIFIVIDSLFVNILSLWTNRFPSFFQYGVYPIHIWPWPKFRLSLLLPVLKLCRWVMNDIVLEQQSHPTWTFWLL